MASRGAVYVAVGRPDALGSPVWKFWVHRDEMYAAAREEGKLYKLSCHSSGIYRLAYISTREGTAREANPHADPRLLARWSKPPPFRPGWTQCFDLLLPATTIQNRFGLDSTREAPKGEIRWIPHAPEGQFWQLTWLLADSRQSVADVLAEGDQLMAELPLRTAGSSYLVLRCAAMSPEGRAWIEEVTSDMRINFDSPPENVIASVWEVDPDHAHPKITVITLGWDSVYVAGKPWIPGSAGSGA
jgi:hypothetical protein